MAKKSLDWAEKYRPSTLAEVQGNDSAVEKLERWAKTWGEHRKPALLFGPPGVGKTSAALALAVDLDWDVLELNASDQRTASVIQQVAGEAALSGTFYGVEGRRVVILDEADNLHGNSDRGGARAITELSAKARQPIILIVNDLYGVSRGLRDRCETIAFRALREATILRVLNQICIKEDLSCEPESLSVIASANRELRGAINDLQAAAAGREVLTKEDVAPSIRDTKETIFEVMKIILQGDDSRAAQQSTYNIDESPEDLVQWVDENLPRAYSGEVLKSGYERLARADVFLGRTRRRQSYRLWRYASFLMTSGVNVAKSGSIGGYLRYQVPQYWMLLGRTRGLRSLRKNVEQKVANRYHMSSREFIQDSLPYFRQMFADDELATSVCARLELDIDEVAFLLDVKKDSARARKIHGSAVNLLELESDENIAIFGGFGSTDKAGTGERRNGNGENGAGGGDELEKRNGGDLVLSDGADIGNSKEQKTLFEY